MRVQCGWFDLVAECYSKQPGKIWIGLDGSVSDTYITNRSQMSVQEPVTVEQAEEFHKKLGELIAQVRHSRDTKILI